MTSDLFGRVSQALADDRLIHAVEQMMTDDDDLATYDTIVGTVADVRERYDLSVEEVNLAINLIRASLAPEGDE